MIIGIGGVSRAGKTSLAESIMNQYKEDRVCLLHMDEYIKSGYNMPHIHDQLDWEDPESIDFHRLTYDFIWISSNVEIVILEGLFAFYDPFICSRFDRKIMVEIDYNTFFKRKTKDKRWGDVPGWYIEHIWKSYDKFGSVEGEDIYRIDGSKPIDLHEVRRFLESNVLV